MINGTKCDGSDHTRCGQARHKDGLDISLGTAYVSNFDNAVSVIPLSH
jgi:hypothetical protein